MSVETTLLLASLQLPSARQLAAVAKARRWRICVLDQAATSNVSGRRTYYGGSDRAMEYAARYQLCLIEPPLGMLARLPADLLCRCVRYGTLATLRSVNGPVFVKPADPILKGFDAGVYRGVQMVRGSASLDPQTPILISEPVEWTSEFRSFVREGRIEAWSPYLSFGRPTWKPGSAGTIPPSLTAFCNRLFDRVGDALPPAFVVDVGVLGDGRWAVVEFNPAWCSGILGADVQGVLNVIERAALFDEMASDDDKRWTRKVQK